MTIERIINIPPPPGDNLGFYEMTTPHCILSSTADTQESIIPLGVYSDLIWETGIPSSDIDNATTWGTKTLPGAGPFYFANHEDGVPDLGHLTN